LDYLLNFLRYATGVGTLARNAAGCRVESENYDCAGGRREIGTWIAGPGDGA
jgi:hypothetical protein